MQKQTLQTKEFIKKEDVEKEFYEFSKFTFQRNTLELAVAVILGASFNKVVTSLSHNLLIPIVNAILSHTGEGWRDFTWIINHDIKIKIGVLLGDCVELILTALILYIFFVKIIKGIFLKYNPFKKYEKEETEDYQI